MDNNKGQTIFLSVIGIATLLVAIVGATFAWFSISVSGNDKASSVVVTTAKLGSVVFTDGETITMNNIRPETSPQETKTFTVANTEKTATETLEYSITLNVDINTLTEAAAGQFVHSLSGASSKTTGAGKLVSVAKDTEVPKTTTQLGTGTLVGNETHTYTYTIQFKESGENQNAAQGKAFGGKLQVNLTTEKVGE